LAYTILSTANGVWMRIVLRLLLPLLLLGVGVVILIGCIPIPSLRTTQSDGRPRPEHFVGNSSKKSVWIGHTKIDYAFIKLSRQIGPTSPAAGWKSSISPRGRSFSTPGDFLPMKH